MWIKRKTFKEFIDIISKHEKHIYLAHMEILRLKKENQMLKNIKPILGVVQNDRRA